MRRLLLIILALCLTCSQAWALSCTSTGSGYWRNASTWGGSCIPGGTGYTNYSGIVAAGHKVEIDDTRSIYAASVGTSTSSIASLYVSGNVTPAFNIRVGDDTSGYVGRLKLRGDSTLNLSATGGISLNKCEFASYSTVSSRAAIAGVGGAILSGTKASNSSGVGMNISLSKVDFSNTGMITIFASPVTDGIITSQYNMQYNTFTGTGSITLGRAGWTNQAVPYSIQHNDFRNTTVSTAYLGAGAYLLLTGTSAAVTSTRNVSYNTFKNSGLATVYKGSGTTNSVLIEKNTFYNSHIDTSNSQYPEIRYNSIYLGATAIRSEVYLHGIFDNYHHNIIATDYLNSHPHAFNAVSATTANTSILDNNIIETSGLDDNPFIPNCGSSTVAVNETYTNNFVIGQIQDGWEMHCSTTSIGNLTIQNNTIISVNQYASYGRLIAGETGTFGTAGTTTVKNNLLYYSGASAGYIYSSYNPHAGDIDYIDYNNYYATPTSGGLNVLNPGVGGAGPTAGAAGWALIPPAGVTYGQDGFGLHDRSFNPMLPNPTYGIETFTGTTKEAFFADQLKINGYGGTSIYTLDNLRTAIMNAYSPGNPALTTAGYGGTYIGAFPIRPIYGIWGLNFGL